MAPPEAAKITRRTVFLSISTATVLIAVKVWAWVASGSVSILSSLADSSLDLAASLMTLWAVIYAAEPPDEEHRFGHGKAEGFAALMQAALVGASAALIAREAIERFFAPRSIENGGLSIGVMVFSIIMTATLIWFQSRAVAKTGSVATKGDMAHYTADLAANVAVIAGVIGAAFLNMPLADPIIGLGVAAWLAWGAFGVARDAVDQLMDRELDDEARARITALAEADDIIVHSLRTRASGPIIHIQFHLEMPNTLSLIEAHEQMVACERRILDEFPGADILIHPDPRGAKPHGGGFFKEKSAEESGRGEALDQVSK